jgi:Response regulators consisting of a CheY-like receiver domain and a winged-helix DNA-binding domain
MLRMVSLPSRCLPRAHRTSTTWCWWTSWCLASMALRPRVRFEHSIARMPRPRRLSPWVPTPLPTTVGFRVRRAWTRTWANLWARKSSSRR